MTFLRKGTLMIWRARIHAWASYQRDRIYLSRPSNAVRNRCWRCLWGPFHD